MPACSRIPRCLETFCCEAPSASVSLSALPAVTVSEWFLLLTAFAGVSQWLYAAVGVITNLLATGAAANRLALLWYARQWCDPPVPAWLVSLYFLGEKYPTVTKAAVGPQSEEEWEPIIEALHKRMGLPHHPHALTPWWIESFLPALQSPGAGCL